MSNDVPEDCMNPDYLKKAFKAFKKRLRLRRGLTPSQHWAAVLSVVDKSQAL